jgi:hypothetical protein
MESLKGGSPPLVDLLRGKARELADLTSARGGAVDPDGLGDLERLARLHEIQTALRKPPRTHVWEAAALGAVVAAVLLLYLIRPASTFVSGEVLAGEVALRVDEEVPVIEGGNLAALSLAGLDSVRLPSGDERFVTLPATSMTLRSDSSASGAGTVDLEEDALPAGTLVRMRLSEGGGAFAWEIDHADSAFRRLHLRATVSGRVTAGVDGRRYVLVSSYGSRVEAFSSGSIQVQVAYADTAPRVLRPIPLGSALAFNRRLTYGDRYHELSTIAAGTLVREDVAGRETRLGPGQALRFSRSQIEVSHLVLERSGIRLRFSGTVGGMTTGTHTQRNLMPRTLERLANSPALLLIGSTVLTVLGYVLGIFGWFTRRR